MVQPRFFHRSGPAPLRAWEYTSHEENADQDGRNDPQDSAEAVRERTPQGCSSDPKNDSRSSALGCAEAGGGISRARTLSCTPTHAGLEKSAMIDSSDSLAAGLASL